MSRRVQKCGLCKQEGHNRRRCPNNDGIIHPIQVNHQIQSIQIMNPDFKIDEVEYINSREDAKGNEFQKTIIHARKDQLVHDETMIKKKELEKKYKNRMNDEELKRKTDKVLEEMRAQGKFKLWFSTQEECGEYIHHYLMNEKKKIILAVAEPGVGKTNLIHYLIYKFKGSSGPSNENLIVGDRLTIATGVSSIDWIRQTEKGTKLRDQNYHEDIYHRDTIHKRIKYLQDNPDLLSDHVFILDECHIACDKGQTLDKLFNDHLGLSKEIIDKLHIKFIFISATPDIMQVELLQKHDDDYEIVKLVPGENYRGGGFIKDQNWLYDYVELNINNKEILKETLSGYTKPKYHIIRICGTKSMLFKKKIMELCAQENIGICLEHNEKERIENIEDKFYETPEKHHFIFIKGFYRVSKRLRLTKNIGMIIEPSVNEDVTVVAQSLLSRFFGYYSDDEMNISEPPMFICKKECMNTYIEYAKGNFKLNRTGTGEIIEYGSRKINYDNGKQAVVIRGNHESYSNKYPEDNPELANTNTNQNNLSRGWCDDYGDNPENVPSERWLNNNDASPQIIKEKFNLQADPMWKDNGGFWCTNTNQNKSLFNEFGQGGGVGQSRNIIVYKDSQSTQFIVRKFTISS